MATPETSKGLKGEADEDAKPILEINDNPLIDNETEPKDNAQNFNVTCNEEIPTDTKDRIANSIEDVDDEIVPIVSNTDKIALSLGT